MVGGSHDASEAGEAGEAGEESRAPHPETATDASALERAPWPLRRATQHWLRRGYTVRYSDAFLAQVVRRTGIGWIGRAYMLASLPLLGIAVWLLVRAVRRRGWHVVSLTITPEGRVLSHRQRTRSEPI